MFTINGFRIKVDFPFEQASLLWDDGAMQVLAKADIVTPDKRSQWFSEFILVTSGWLISISPRRSGLPHEDNADTLKTLSITISENDGKAAVVTHPGLFTIGNGQVDLIEELRLAADPAISKTIN